MLCPRVLAANAKVSRGGLSLVNTPRGGEHCFQELSYWGLKFMSSVGGVRILIGIAHSLVTCALDAGMNPGCSLAAHVNTCD